MKRWIHASENILETEYNELNDTFDEIVGAFGIDSQFQQYLEDLAINDVGEGWKADYREFSHTLENAGYKPSSRAFRHYSKAYDKCLKGITGATESGEITNEYINEYFKNID